jgi:iron complex transport system ATP-binding protein
MLEVAKASLGYGRRPVLSSLDLAIESSSITAVVGPNGSGKSTLLKGLAGLLCPSEGKIVLEGRELKSYRRADLALRLAFLAQAPVVPAGLLVRELVSYGRFPHRRRGGGAEADRRAVERAIALAGLSKIAGRRVESLSGGERQRAWIAMAIAQETDYLLLDEPMTYLDLRGQLEVVELIRSLHEERGTAVVMAIHDLNLAARSAHRMIAMKAGRIEADGPPSAVVSPAILEGVFGVEGRFYEEGSRSCCFSALRALPRD